VPDADIEVVVLDNCSTDETVDELSPISDPRFKLITRSENRGALINMVDIFDFASGKYKVYSTDQDQTNVKKIADFKKFLSLNPGVTCGFCEFNPPKNYESFIFPKGFLAINAVAYKSRHPTGYFFRADSLRSIRLNERFSDHNKVGLFPLEFAFAELALQGDAAIYGGGIFSPNEGADWVQRKSSTTSGDSKSSFFSPDSRLRSAISYSQHVNELNLSYGEKLSLKAQIFLEGFLLATKGYRAIMENEPLCLHYSMSHRAIGFIELSRIGMVYVYLYISHKNNQAIFSNLAILAITVAKFSKVALKKCMYLR
jgi:glycosyltransferase involved in cell wall biosynthesis